MSRDRPPEIFNSDIHLSRWRRMVIWLCENPVGGWPEANLHFRCVDRAPGAPQ